MPVHGQEIMKILDEVIAKYYQKCMNRYQTIVVGGEQDYSESDSVLSSQWAKDPEIQAVLRQNSYLESETSVNSEFNQILCQKQTAIESSKKGDRSLHRSELIFEPRKIQSLAGLYYGLRWLLDQIQYLRVTNEIVDENAEPQFSPSAELLREVSELSEDSLLDLEFDTNQVLPLKLTPEMSEKVNESLRLIRGLMDECLFTLHLEIRCHVRFYLDLAIREGSYYLEDQYSDPDPYIGILNTDLSSFDEVINDSVPYRIHRSFWLT